MENEEKNLAPQEEQTKLPVDPRPFRDACDKLIAVMNAQPDQYKVDLETQHDFIDGVYMRTVLMKKGELVAGKIHKLEHMVVVSKGAATVLSEEFGIAVIQAPAIFKSPPMVRRILTIHEEMVWTTVHPNPTNTRDLKELEAALIASGYELPEGKT